MLTLMPVLSTKAMVIAWLLLPFLAAVLPPLVRWMALLGTYGVALKTDAFAVPFLLLLMVLHGGLSSAFVVQDLISLYVPLRWWGSAPFC